jgi:hypothetical protein
LTLAGALPVGLAANGSAGEPEAGDVAASFRQGLIFVRASVNKGPEGVFLLDTGASETVVDARYAAQTNVKLGDALILKGGGGARDARQGEDAHLRLSGGQTGRIDPTVADLSPVAAGMGQRLDGILGDDFLGRYVLELDYRERRVALRMPDVMRPPADAAPIRFVRTPFVLARVTRGAHSAEAELQIDTGSNTALEFWRPFSHAAFPDARGFEGQGLGVAGGTLNRKTRIDLLEVAGRRIAGVEANLDDDTRPDDADARYGGVIGGPAWAGLVVTLDFPRGRLWVR